MSPFGCNGALWRKKRQADFPEPAARDSVCKIFCNEPVRLRAVNNVAVGAASGGGASAIGKSWLHFPGSEREGSAA